MSSSLHWRPSNHEGEPFTEDADGLKFALRGDQGYVGEWITFDRSSLGYLEGVRDGAGRKSSTGKATQELIDLINKHGEVEVREVS